MNQSGPYLIAKTEVKRPRLGNISSHGKQNKKVHGNLDGKGDKEIITHEKNIFLERRNNNRADLN